MYASLVTSYHSLDKNFMVAVRVRPQTQTQIECNDLCEVSQDETQVCLANDKVFTFDHVFDTNTEQQHIYDTCVKDLIDSCFEGYNATVLAYGQTGSGKTYTMGTGFNEFTSTYNETRGIIPRAVEHLFSEIDLKQKCARDNGEAIPEFKVNVQYIELYNEEIKDLLIDAPSNHTEVKTHEDSSGRIYLNDVTSRPVRSIGETLEFLKIDAQSRTTDETLMNAHSSRSHAIFTLHIKQHRVVTIEPDLHENGNDVQLNDLIGNREFETLSAKFHFVDLAGSESLNSTGATGERARESISINSGLSALDNVIKELTHEEKRATHVPYRDSKLTHLLQDSLGGNCRTLLIACISPCHRDSNETLNTLQYANRVKNIRNKVTVNNNKSSQTIVALRAEIEALRNELKENKLLIDCEKMNEALKRENIKQNEELNEYKTLHQNLSKTFDEKCAQYNRVFGLYEELQKDFVNKCQENEEKVKNLLNNLNACEIEKQSIIEHKNQILCENQIQKQKIEECVKVITEKENLVISCKTEVKHLQKQLNEKEVAFNQLLVEKNHQKEEFDKLESVLNNNLKQKTLEIIKLNENLSKTRSEKCSQLQRNSTETHSLSPRLNDTMSGVNDIEYEADMSDTSTRNNIDQSITDTLTTNVDNEMQSNSHQLLISHIRQPLSDNTFDANHNHIEIIEKTFNTDSDNDNSLSDERCNNAKQKPYKCVWPQCGKMFNYKQDLCEHKNHHIGDKPYKCDYNDCAKSFAASSGLKRHKRIIHTKQKSFKCEYIGCAMSFVTQSYLNSHIKYKHTKEKLFKCDFDNCGKEFVRSTDLTTHKNRHNGHKRYKCNYDNCVIRFVTLAELKIHIKLIHTKQKQFKCDFNNCGKEFVTAINLRKHKLEKHAKK